MPTLDRDLPTTEPEGNPMNMMQNMAIADAYGAGREYAPAADVAANNDGITYVQHQKWADLTPGKYTDDTQMAIALAEYLMEDGEYNTTDLACKFVNTFKRDERAGYAGGFYKLLQDVKTGYELVDRLSPMSDKSGGAMRAAPCGLLATIDDVRDVAMWQASVTHATRDGMNAAAASALLVWACRQGIDQGFLPQFLNDTVPGYQWDIPWTGPVGAPGIHAVKAALDALVNEATLHDILVHAVAFTGDVDTVAAIAIAAASMHKDIDQNLNPALLRNLEGGKYGWRFLQALDAKLEKAFPLPTPKVKVDPDAPLPPGVVIPFGDFLDLFD